MKIADTTPIRQAATLRRRSATGGASDFSDYLAAAEAGGPEGAASTGDVASLGGVGLLAFQEVSDEELRRKKVISQGHSLLDALENLRQSLLMGQVPLDVLRTLDARLSVQRAQTADPALHGIMDDIELRAAVERAKLEMALKNNENTV